MSLKSCFMKPAYGRKSVIGNEREEPDMKKTVSILLAAALLLSSLAGCGNGGGGGKSDVATLSPEATSVTLPNGVSIELQLCV